MEMTVANIYNIVKIRIKKPIIKNINHDLLSFKLLRIMNLCVPCHV